MKKLTWRDITVSYDSEELSFSNSCFSRTYDIGGGFLKTREIRSSSGELIACGSEYFNDFECYGYARPRGIAVSRLESVSGEAVESDPFEGPHYLLKVVLSENIGGNSMVREFRLFPGQPFFSVRNGICSQIYPGNFWLHRPELSRVYTPILGAEEFRDEPLMETIHPAPGYKVVRTVEFFGHTDTHNHPVVEHPAGTCQRCFTGNLLYCENASGAGFMILQEAPPTSERREREEYDFRLTPAGDIKSLCWGILPEDLGNGDWLYSYRNMVAFYENAEERSVLLKRYLKLRTAHAEIPLAVVTNSWGCGNFKKRISGDFLRTEIAAAGECGAEYYQIDDGWQKGVILDSINLKNHKTELKRFWSPEPAAVGSEDFHELTELAEKAGIKLALWTAPTTSIGYRNVAEFQELIMDFYRKYGCRLFKLDNACYHTHFAEENFERLIRQTRLVTDKKIFFNLDVTGGHRGGYFMFNEYGSLFLENRYVAHSYHPELTLRNLWNLSAYIRPQTLQIEIPFIGAVKPEKYASRGLCSPDVYSWKYWIAISFFANPLLWFAPSDVPPEQRRELREMLELYYGLREEIFAGEIYPVGSGPDGGALTGLVSRDETGRNNLAVLFRERNAEKSELQLPGNWKLVAGCGIAAKDCLQIPEQKEFAIFRNVRPAEV